MSETPFEREQEEAAAEEAAAIGGHVSYSHLGDQDEPVDPARAPLIEAGEGEAEGFELAEQELEEHASHGDLHAARHAASDAFDEYDDPRAAAGGEADHETSSERGDEDDEQ